MRRRFLEFVEQKEAEKSGGTGPDEPLGSKVSLGDGNDFQPFTISDDPNSQHYGKNKSLAPIVRAFKKGANWGWSKDEKSGEDKPVKLGSKKLYLTGGALRDHLAGKTPRNMELATNCSPDEVYHILTQNKFKYIGDEKDAEKTKAQGQNVFWVKSKDSKGRPYVFGVKVKNDEFQLSVFTKPGQSKDGKSIEPGNHSDDAANRDFTINAMYLALNNDNGPNKELNDFYGGIHHLKSGKIASVGDLGGKIKDDPIRAMRYARMLSRYGDPKKTPEEEKEVIRKSAEHLGKVKPKDLHDEFFKGLNHDDQDPRSYLQTYNDLGLLGSLFPGMDLDTELPKELRELGDKHAPIAWMLRKHDPNDVQTKLGSNWKPEDLKKVMFLIKMLGLDDNTDADGLDDLVKGYMGSGISGRKLKQWTTKLGGKHEALADAFLKHAMSPRMSMKTSSDHLSDLSDPEARKAHNEETELQKKTMELQNFRRILGEMMPKN